MIHKKIKREFERFKKKVFHSSKTHKQLEQTQYELGNMPYELYDKFRKNCLEVTLPTIKSLEETVEKIVKDRCSIARFGDGEFSCMNKGRIAFHDSNPKLAEGLKKTISSNIPNLMIALPDCFGSLDCYVSYSQKFWRKYMGKKRQMVYSYLDMDKIYYNAFVNRFYLNYNKTEQFFQKCETYVKKLKLIWKDRDVVLFESQQARLGVGNDILDGAKSISRILFCPEKNAFEKYDKILASFESISNDSLLLLSLGPTATVLAHDLCEKGYQAIDIGHISEEYECFLRKETPLESNNAGKKLSLRHLADPNDPEYKKQIIKVIE